MAISDHLPNQLGFSFETAAPTRRVWPVRELVAEVRELVEAAFCDVWVEGNISNFVLAPSVHMYFTLKDADAQLQVVCSSGSEHQARPATASASAPPGQHCNAREEVVRTGHLADCKADRYSGEARLPARLC